MRIVHLSDIHLSKQNFNEFQNNFKDALLKDLCDYHQSIPIDLIIITGDLVDKGGHSLFEIDEYKAYKDVKNPYEIFEEVFLNPIISSLRFPKNNILFIPGNHDVDEREILLFEESEMIKNINKDNVIEYLNGNKTFVNNHRIKKFKEFERKFHNDNSLYEYTNNHSNYIYNDKHGLVGFLLINDSWRCKSVKFSNEKKLFFGAQQIIDGIKSLDEKNTVLNICLFHHSTEDFEEKDIVEGLLNRKKIELFLYGHFHSTKTDMFYTPHGSCQGFRSRATLFKPEEILTEFQSGYQIIDIDVLNYKISEIHYRKYDNNEKSKQFISDNETAPDNGVDRNRINDNKGFPLYRENRVKPPMNYDKKDFIS
jgi:Icc-related predicted phosphoesterase